MLVIRLRINPGRILTERLLKMRSGLNPASADASADDAFRRMTPLGRVGRPEEVADLVLFLASARAAFIHGANITIDGVKPSEALRVLPARSTVPMASSWL